MRFFRQIQGCAQARTVGARFKIRVTKADVSGIILIYRLLNIYFWNSIYTAGGDRSLKLTGANQQMLINNQYYINFANLNENKSLYMGAYMVLMNSNYTKHYYIEGERVCTKIGGGFGPGPNIPFKGELHPLVGDYETMRHELWKMTMRFRECTQGPDLTINENLEPGHNGEDNFEELQYFYHPDHLGSSSFITDATGYATQHLQYLPFGETFVDQQNGYDSRYTFSAKEKDDETQYSYFGARYYDSDLSVWLSVDPMSDKYLSTSPYMYCLGNPIVLVDPNGMESDDWVEKTDDNGNKTIVWDDNVTSADDPDLKSGDKYLGKDGYSFNESTGSAIHYKPDKTTEEFTQTLPQINVQYDEIRENEYAYMANNPSISTTNRTGLIWDERDLAVWNAVGTSESPIGIYIRHMITSGNYEMLSAERYWNTYGTLLGSLIAFQEFFDCMNTVNSAPIMRPYSLSRSYYYINSSRIVHSNTAPLSFQQWLQNNSGRYQGQFKGQKPGSFFKQAWTDYKAGKYR